MWKANWEETKQRFVRWWNREGLVVGMWGAPETGRPVHEVAEPPAVPATIEERYCDAAYRAAENHYRLSRSVFPLDVLPMANTDLGPGSLALFLGSRPDFAEDTVWFHPCMEHEAEPEKLPPLRFDPGNPWWKRTEEIVRRCAELARGKYLVGCPDLIENVDVLSSLRGAQTLCLDMIERPGWVEQKVREINQVWFEAYQRIYDIIRLEDGGAAFGAFFLWGPGKTAKLQCDSSAMFSPAMFKRFVVPALTEQCDWLDYSLYHLDGTQAMKHLDALLAIESLDAIEWTPQAGIETGGNRRWYDLYRRILGAGKSVQVVNVELNEVEPLLEAIGTKGVYVMIQFKDEREAELVQELIARFH
ncbi:MAG TPA: hypothetical protein GYA07_15325 [Verrucomicrobia bacterium]|nr:hypothetical protein [Verrucomicrobiota bacterium]HOB31551.1 hypothetical protein [Verrucomicrobiota bacterium]HOP96565.1 hypothetical protein [Verrucomicrobiota bacterium]HPU56536.1 hypothetical protein [Verrucomicrobiota bacterium]